MSFDGFFLDFHQFTIPSHQSPLFNIKNPIDLTKKKKKATHANAKHNQKGQKKMKPQKTQMSVSSMDWEVSLAQIPVPIVQTIIPMRYMDNVVTIVIVRYSLFRITN